MSFEALIDVSPDDRSFEAAFQAQDCTQSCRSIIDPDDSFGLYNSTLLAPRGMSSAGVCNEQRMRSKHLRGEDRDQKSKTGGGQRQDRGLSSGPRRKTAERERTSKNSLS